MVYDIYFGCRVENDRIGLGIIIKIVKLVFGYEIN